MNKTPTRVALVAEYPLDPERVDGGVQAATKYLTHALAGVPTIDLHVITFYASVKSPVLRQEAGITRHLLPRRRLGSLTRWRRDSWALRRCLGEIAPDVVHAQGAGMEGYLAVSSGYRCVVTFHGMMGIDAKFEKRLVPRLRESRNSRITEHYCAANADHAIVISPYVEEIFGATLKARRHYIPNPTGDQFYCVKRREEAGRILFAGRLIPLKGVAGLIRALAAIKKNHVDAHLVLAGSLDDSAHVQSLQQLAEDLGVAPHVDFRGLLNESEMLEEFGRAAVLAVPSLQENAPMVIQQAMAAGLPVVATRVGGVPHMVMPDETGLLVDPGHDGQLANALTSILADTAFRHRLGRTARLRADAFTATAVARQTAQVYQAAADGEASQCAE